MAVIFIVISQILLYLCFSILAGIFILLLVPSKYRPDIKIPMHTLPIFIIMIPVLTFFPVLDIALFLAPRMGKDIFESLQIVLTAYTIGIAWSFTLLVSSLLLLLITLEKSIRKNISASLGLLFTFGLILTVAWTSHASSMDPVRGIIGDFIHLTAVSVWVGIILIVGWCSLNHKNWLEFLNWFSKVAIGCLVATALSGLFLMDVMVDSYTNSWIVSYGQGLLLKHLFILPLLFYALVNGLIVKFSITKDPTFNPTFWIRVEGIILFVIFTITAHFSQQPPPHGNYLTSAEVSPLFQLFHNNSIDSGSTITLAMSLNTLCFFLLSILFIVLMVLSFFNKASIMVSVLFSCLFVTSIYLMIMVTTVLL